MADHIPFINSQKDAALAKDYYADSAYFRLSLELISQKPATRPNGKIWIDAGVDGFAQPNPNPQWKAFAHRFASATSFSENICTPNKQTVDSFVRSVLDACVKHSPEWISVPQLPYSRDTSRNKTNRMLAAATAEWRKTASFRGVLILPIILTHQEQTKNRTHWKHSVDLATTCFERSGAQGYWIADQDLSDQAGTGSFESRRFPGLIGFCEDVKKKATPAISVAGPFWGLNILLWARGIVEHPAIGVGNAYRYNIAGGRQMQATTRVALEPLLRWVTLSAQLRNWLQQSVARIPPSEPAHRAFNDLVTEYDRLQIDDRARRQIARFYKKWFDGLAHVPPQGRPLELYQALSAAYVLGKSLTELPNTEGSARRPEKIARQLMVNCL